MNFKFNKISKIILGVVAVMLASCSSELNGDDNNAVSVTGTAKRPLSVSVEGATRSIVSVKTGNKWVAGDRFSAYNLTSNQTFDQLTAIGSGASSRLQGDVNCAPGDKIAIFYPYKLSAGHNQHEVEISMDLAVVTEGGNVVQKRQNGKIDQLRYFDYSYGTIDKVKVDAQGQATGTATLNKQYAILQLNFVATTGELKNIKKLTISNVIKEAKFNLKDSTLKEPFMGDIEVTPSVATDTFEVAVFPDANFKPVFKIETSDNKQYIFTAPGGKKIERAKYYPITVRVKEFIPDPPYIEIGGVLWSKYNLQYTPNKQTPGWVEGYHLAANPWDYFYTEKTGPMPQIGDFSGRPLGEDYTGIAFDHFRWGDIKNAHNYSGDMMNFYWTDKGNLQKRSSADGNYGDLAYYASNGTWMMPSLEDFKKLYNNTAMYMGYFIDDAGNYIYGALFDPHASADLKGWIIGNNNKKLRKSEATGLVHNGKANLRKFEKKDFEKALFLPMAGMYTYDASKRLDKPGTQGAYWLANSNPNKAFADKQAMAYMMNVHTSAEVQSGILTSGFLPAKRQMHSIRPIFVPK